MTEIEIIEPKIEDQVEINNLAKQVHKLHVDWNPDIFLDVEQVIPIERLKKLLEAKSIFIAKKENKIVGYIIVNITEKNNGFMRYRKLLDIDTLCIDENIEDRELGQRCLILQKN